MEECINAINSCYTFGKTESEFRNKHMKMMYCLLDLYQRQKPFLLAALLKVRFSSHQTHIRRVINEQI